MTMAVPEYAYWTSGDGEKEAVVIVQAEEAAGFKILGFRTLQGQNYAAFASEIEFLGTEPP
jgi:hypothetical protein